MPARVAFAAAALLLLAACSSAPDAGDTAVLGAATERGDVALETPEPTTTPQPATPAPQPSTPDPLALATAEPSTPDGETQAPPDTAGSSTEPPAGATAAPSPEPDADEPEALPSGEGWTMNALLPDADGEGWTEVGGPPPVEREGESPARLLVRLLHVPTPGDSAGRRASCEAWLEGSPERAVRARGEARMELQVDGVPVMEQRHSLDVTVAAGQRHDLPSWQQAPLVHAADGVTVACTVSFAARG